MKYLEMLATEIERQKKIDALMTMKRAKSEEIKEIDRALRTLILKNKKR